MSASVMPAAFKPLHPLGMRLPRAKGADVETVTRERMLQCRVVDLRIVRERNKGGVVVDAERRQRDVRPLRNHFDIGKSFDRSKCGARIDDGHVIAEQLPERRQRLADMDRAGYDQPRRRHVDGEENSALRRFFHAAFGHAQALFEGLVAADLLRLPAAFTSRCSPLATSVTSTAARRAARSALSACRMSSFTPQLTFST